MSARRVAVLVKKKEVRWSWFLWERGRRIMLLGPEDSKRFIDFR